MPATHDFYIVLSLIEVLALSPHREAQATWTTMLMHEVGE
jgi:hypothetical protein